MSDIYLIRKISYKFKVSVALLKEISHVGENDNTFGI